MNELRFEIHRRNLNICVKGKLKHELIQILLTNDKDLEEEHPEEDDIELAYAAQQNAVLLDELDPDLEADNESKEDENDSTNLDDPEIMAILMEDLRVCFAPGHPER